MANLPDLHGRKPRIAVHKFSSCDDCQLALLNAGEDLIELSNLVDIVHFLEAGLEDTRADVDIAFIEGSISTPEELERIKQVRENTRFLVPIGACATAGGPQALRNLGPGGRDPLRGHRGHPPAGKLSATRFALRAGHAPRGHWIRLHRGTTGYALASLRAG